jgi:hypothetical protein
MAVERPLRNAPVRRQLRPVKQGPLAATTDPSTAHEIATVEEVMRANVLTVVTATAVALTSVSPALADPAPSTPTSALVRPSTHSHDVSVDRRKGCGFSQLEGDTGTMIIATDFDPAYDAYDSWAADDFVCARSVRHLRRIVGVGVYNDTPDVGSSVDLRILANDRTGEADEPSDRKIVCTLAEMPYETSASFSSGFIVRAKDVPCHLKAGRPYWLEVQMNMQGGDAVSNWSWELTTVGQGSTGDWRNPLSGWSDECVTYSREGAGGDRSAPDCGWPDRPGADFMFAVR